MEYGPRRGGVAARALLAVVVLTTLTACVGEQKAIPLAKPAPSISATPENPGVQASGLPEGVELEVTDSSVGAENGADLDFVSPVFTVRPAGALDQPVTVTVELDNALPTTTPVVVATRASEDQPWSFQSGRLTSDQRHVEYTATSLNQLGVLSMNLEAALASFQSDIRAGLAAGVDKTVKPPTCQGRPEARLGGYSVTSSKSQALHWCLGLENGKRVLRVTNRLQNPVEVAHPKVPVLQAPPVPGAFTQWTALLGQDNTFLAPGRTATYDADLEPTTALTVGSDTNARLQSLRLLQATAQGVVARLTDFGAGPATVEKTVSDLLARPQCHQSLGKGSDALVAGCFGQDKMTRLFGSRALLLAPLFAAPASATFFREQGQALIGAQAAAQQRIDVKRAAPDFTGFAGLWSGRTRSLVVSGAGQVTETLYDALGKLVVKLDYQLTDPLAKGGTATAGAKITAVKVGQRKLLNGRVPRVGDAGTLSVTKGVVRPPYLNTSYCDVPRAKRGVCGR